MLRYRGLGSGSSGNATLVEAHGLLDHSRLLIDCGFSVRETERRLLAAGVEPESIDAIFITHEHGDHVGGAAAFARRHGCAVWTSRGTWTAMGSPELPALRLVRDGEHLALGALELRPFTVPHDAAEPLQLRVGDGAHALGVLTDVGAPTPHLLRHLARCDALLLECNHDPDLLAASGYPAMLKSRIAGRLGHLANGVAAEILAACHHAGLQHLVAAHLSERNNTPALARAALAPVVGGGGEDIVVADPMMGFGWLELR